MQTIVTRRGFVAATLRSIGFFGLAVAVPLGSFGCAVPAEAELNRRLIASLRALVGDRAGEGSVSGSIEMEASDALALLRAGRSERRLVALTWNRRFMRAFVDDLREEDFRAGRTRYVDGWLMAETEVAIAVLLGL